MVAVAPTWERVLKQTNKQTNDKGKLPVPPETSHRLKSGVLKLELLK